VAIIVLSLVVLVAIAGVGVALASGGDSKTARSVRDSVYSPPASAVKPAQRCIDLWNGGDNSTNRSILAGYGNAGDLYVSVGLAANYPDLCLVTLAVPAADLALQFLESSTFSEPFQPQGDLSASSLDPSVTNWNATIAGDGALTLE
jgi:hypothetical protein